MFLIFMGLSLASCQGEPSPTSSWPTLVTLDPVPQPSSLPAMSPWALSQALLAARSLPKPACCHSPHCLVPRPTELQQ